MTKLKNYISSAHFRGGKTQEDILSELLIMKREGKHNFLFCGTLYGVGVASEEVERDPNHPDAAKYANKPLSINIIGEFKFISEFTGEVTEGLGVIAPRFAAKMIVAQLAKQSDAMLAWRVGAEYTGRSIPWAWAIENVMDRPATSPFAVLEAQLQSTGKLALPAPTTTMQQVAHEAPAQRKGAKTAS